MIEQWRTIKDYPDYEISSFGSIRRLKKSKGNWRWPSGYIKALSLNRKDGYFKVMLNNSTGIKNHYIHRLVLSTFHGECPDGKECNHIDGNKLNNNISNLEWVTAKENTAHAHRTGLMNCVGGIGRVGILHPMCRLKEGEIWLIKRLLSSGKVNQNDISKMFRVNQTTISKIHLGKRWSHLESKA